MRAPRAFAALLALSLPLAACGGASLVGGPGNADGGPPPDAAVPRDFRGCVDEDGDGYGVGCAKGPDCDDHDARIHPGADEFCGEGIDQNCDGKTEQPDCLCHAGATQSCYGGPTGT